MYPKRDVYVSPRPAPRGAPFINVWVKTPDGWIVRAYPHTPRLLVRACHLKIMAKFASQKDTL